MLACIQADLKTYTKLQKYVQKKCVKSYFEGREAVGLADFDPNLNLLRYVVGVSLLCMLWVCPCCVCGGCVPAVYVVGVSLLCMWWVCPCCVCGGCVPAVYVVGVSLLCVVGVSLLCMWWVCPC